MQELLQLGEVSNLTILIVNILLEWRREIQSGMSEWSGVSEQRIVLVEAWRQVANPEERKRLPLEPVTRKLVKTHVTDQTKLLLC
jgi:hypothetical protein